MVFVTKRMRFPRYKHPTRGCPLCIPGTHEFIDTQNPSGLVDPTHVLIKSNNQLSNFVKFILGRWSVSVSEGKRRKDPIELSTGHETV